MTSVQHGCLVLADISGYTKYLTGVALEHSHDVLADLMGVVVDQTRGALHLAKLEGDAVFCYDHDGETDGSMLLTTVESCYFAFAQRLLLIQQHTTCQCDACLLVPRLNLKFLVHHGEYVQHDVARSSELVGPDVILSHRLLKNSITEKTQLRGYAFFTQACLTHFGLDPVPLRMTAHHEAYEDLGAVQGYIHNLEARWQEEQARRVVYVARDQVGAVEFEVPVPPAVAWEYLTSPLKKPLWLVGVERVKQDNPRGLRGVGTTNHCFHGEKSIFEEEILDWKPFRYYTFLVTIPIMGRFLVTHELSAVQEGAHTRVSWRRMPKGGLMQRLALRRYGAKMTAMLYTSKENFVHLVSSLQPDVRDQTGVETTC